MEPLLLSLATLDVGTLTDRWDIDDGLYPARDILIVDP